MFGAPAKLAWLFALNVCFTVIFSFAHIFFQFIDKQKKPKNRHKPLQSYNLWQKSVNTQAERDSYGGRKLNRVANWTHFLKQLRFTYVVTIKITIGNIALRIKCNATRWGEIMSYFSCHLYGLLQLTVFLLPLSSRSIGIHLMCMRFMLLLISRSHSDGHAECCPSLLLCKTTFVRSFILSNWRFFFIWILVCV